MVVGGLLSDLWTGVPKELKVIFGIAIFVNVGVTIVNVMILGWNLLAVNAFNAVNGCVFDASLCVPQTDGIIIFGINFADYWVINALIFFPVLALFAIKWYAMVSNMTPRRS